MNCETVVVLGQSTFSKLHCSQGLSRASEEKYHIMYLCNLCIHYVRHQKVIINIFTLNSENLHLHQQTLPFELH
jgi:hypothetical protein